MPDRIWLGGTYIKDEGGYIIIIKSLIHYKNRLRTIGQSPELRGAAAMFASILRSQAAKTFPQIDKMVCNVHDGLTNHSTLAAIKNDVDFLEKALICYESDILKAQNTGHEYFVGLVGNMVKATSDLDTIKTAREKIHLFV